MINVSKEFARLMNTRTDFKQNAEIALADGTVLELTEKDFTIDNNSVTDGADSNGIPLGVAVCRSIQIEIMNDDGKFSTYDFFGARIRLYLTFQLSETVERIEYGAFTVLTPETYGETVIITALDDMYKADKDYIPGIAYPATLQAILVDACDSLDIPLGTTSFANDDFIVDVAPAEITYRQLIGYVAMLAGGNARIDVTGRLRIISYDFAKIDDVFGFVYAGGQFNPWDNVDDLHGGTFNPWNDGDTASGGTYGDRDDVHILYNWSNLKVDTDDVVITGIQTEYTDDNNEDQTVISGSEGYVLKIENPLIAGKESDAVAMIGAIMIGGRFRQFSGDLIANPTCEFMDLAMVLDRKGNSYITFITDVNFQFFGFTTLKNSAEPALRNSAKTYSEAAKTFVKARKLITEERTARELAVEQLAKDLKNSSGLFMTEEVQSDKSVIYYMHDKPTLAESMIVWKLTALAFGISTDGGKTYPYGFTVDGETVTRLLYAEGINADYITSGTINSDLINIESKLIESDYTAIAKLVGGGIKISTYKNTESPDEAVEIAQLSGVLGEASGALVLRKNGIRDITLAAGGGRGLQIFSNVDGSKLVASMYRNDNYNSGAIQLRMIDAGESKTFFYVGVSSANYKMQFSNWTFTSYGSTEDRLFAGGNIMLQNINGTRKAYLDQLNVGGSAMTTLAWKWSSELSAFVLTGTQ